MQGWAAQSVLVVIILLLSTPSIGAAALSNQEYAGPAPFEPVKPQAPSETTPSQVFSKIASANFSGASSSQSQITSGGGSGYMYYLNGWTYLHIEGSPYEIGYMYGYALAANISYGMGAYERLLVRQNTDWSHLRNNSMTYWPNIPDEYRQEMIGIADGLAAKGEVFPGTSRQLDLIDVVGINAAIDISYRDGDIAKKKAALPKLPSDILSGARSASPELSAALLADGSNFSIAGYWAADYPSQDGASYEDGETYDSCSGFAAAGDAVAGGGVLMGSETWFGYYLGMSYRFFLDIIPTSGYQVQFQTFPGMIWSSTDWYVNSAGISFAETTVGSGAYNYDKTPVFVRARKAAQYGNSLDSVIDILRTDSNGAYGNDWQMVDAKTGEAAILELGATAWGLKRTKNGFLGTCNFPWDPGVRKELGLDPSFNNTTTPPRWDRFAQYEKIYYGKFDAYIGRQLLSDHVNAKTGEDKPNGSNTMCGHYEVRLVNPYCHGSLDAKVVDSRMIMNMESYGAAGHPCGTDFYAEELLNKNPNLTWTKPYLVDLIAYPWTCLSRLVDFKPKVVYESGAAAAGAWVELTNSVDKRRSVVHTDPSGVANFGKVTAGSYDVVIYPDGGGAPSGGKPGPVHFDIAYNSEPVLVIPDPPSAFGTRAAFTIYAIIAVVVFAVIYYKLSGKEEKATKKSAAPSSSRSSAIHARPKDAKLQKRNGR